ncbi:MAG TPA: hypothetical protein EYQ20_12540, partial [candidate division Zixibacteria bacterium]|nr:hypothetical protein [candidate division Zixibacteria bacterium]
MDLDVPMIAVKLLTGLVIGASIGLTGIGGGVLVLPTLTLLFGLPPTVAVGTANLYSFLCKLSATYFHYKQKTIAFGTSGYFLMGAIPANLAVSIGLTWYAASLQEDEAAWQAFQAVSRLGAEGGAEVLGAEVIGLVPARVLTDAAAAAVRAIVKTQQAIRADISLATEVGKKLFPESDAAMIADVVERDLPYYDASISEEFVLG